MHNDWKTGKWREQKKEPCGDPNHNGPQMIYIPPGSSVRHSCPRCGSITIIHGSDYTTTNKT